jgi:hypothetical protein
MFDNQKSCSATWPLGIPSANGPTGPTPGPGPTGPVAKPAFTTGTINLGESTDLFVKLAYSVPFTTSSIDAFITSLVSKKFISNFEPTYFQIPYIYSAADNLINGNYTSSVSNIGNKIITSYVIPYKSLLGPKNVTITTYVDTITNILFYEIPREFSYNSKDQASVAVTPSGPDYIGKVSIPSSFINQDDKSSYYKIINYKVMASADLRVPANQPLAQSSAIGQPQVQTAFIQVENATASYCVLCSCCNGSPGKCAEYTGEGVASSTEVNSLCQSIGCTFAPPCTPLQSS